MTFQELLAEVQKLKRDELRVHTEEYLEVVVSKEDLVPLTQVLTAHFGPPLKPEGDAPSREARQCAAPYGGIRKDQTMFFRQGEALPEIALFWPWGSGARITVKLIQVKGSGSDEGFLGALTGLFNRK